MRAHALVCVRMCVVLQVLGQVLQVLGRMCVVLQVLSRSVVLQVLRRMCVVLLGQVLGLGLGLGLGLLCSSLFTHPQNFIFANPGQPRSLKININDTRIIPEGKKRYLPGMISERYGNHFASPSNRVWGLLQTDSSPNLFLPVLLFLHCNIFPLNG